LITTVEYKCCSCYRDFSPCCGTKFFAWKKFVVKTPTSYWRYSTSKFNCNKMCIFFL